MIECKETEEGFEITWDPDDPLESVLNTWTEQDFIDVITQHAMQTLNENETI